MTRKTQDIIILSALSVFGVAVALWIGLSHIDKGEPTEPICIELAGMDGQHPPVAQVAPRVAHRTDLQWAIARWNTAKFPLLQLCEPVGASGGPAGVVRPQRPVRVYWTSQHLPPSIAAYPCGAVFMNTDEITLHISVADVGMYKPCLVHELGHVLGMPHGAGIMRAGFDVETASGWIVTNQNRKDARVLRREGVEGMLD